MTRRKKWIIIGTVVATLIIGLTAPILFIKYVNNKVTCHGAASLYCEQGGNYLLKGQYELALKDFDKAISFIPENPAPYILRGLTYRTMDDYDHAEQDFKMALQLSSKLHLLSIYQTNALLPLQVTYFLKGDFASAALTDEIVLKTYKENNKHFLKLYHADDANIIILRHIDLMRSGQDDHIEFDENSKTATSDAWLRSVLEFFAGHISSDELIQKATNPNLEVQKRQICQANFYIGESLFSSNKSNATPYFKASDQICSPGSSYQLAAHSELTRISSQ